MLIRIQEGKWIRIHADPDLQPWHCEVTLNPYLTFQVLTAGQRSLGFCLFLPGCQKWWLWLCSSSGGSQSPALPQTPGPRSPGPRSPGPRTPGPRTPGPRTPGPRTPRTPGPPGCPPPQTPHVPFTKWKVSIQGIFLNKCKAKLETMLQRSVFDTPTTNPQTQNSSLLELGYFRFKSRYRCIKYRTRLHRNKISKPGVDGN